MAQSSDEIIKREIIEKIGHEFNGLQLRAFPESSDADQVPFGDAEGLTFGVDGKLYGSCDACWVIKRPWKNPYNNKIVQYTPIVALEGTDALNRGSSGDAQYQRFHHALGAVKAGLIGVYYLKRGADKIQEDLYGMAVNATKVEKGTYLIIDDLDELKILLSIIHDEVKLKDFVDKKMKSMYKIFKKKFDKMYGTWDEFGKKRSTLIYDKYVIKYSGRMKRNFTDGSQRAGHIAVGEMLLTKYYFPGKHVFCLWPKMTREDVEYLDTHKKDDKEWSILRNEEGVSIVTIDDLENVPSLARKGLMQIADKPLKGDVKRTYNSNVDILVDGFRKGMIVLKPAVLKNLK